MSVEERPPIQIRIDDGWFAIEIDRTDFATAVEGIRGRNPEWLTGLECTFVFVPKLGSGGRPPNEPVRIDRCVWWETFCDLLEALVALSQGAEEQEVFLLATEWVLDLVPRGPEILVGLRSSAGARREIGAVNRAKCNRCVVTIVADVVDRISTEAPGARHLETIRKLRAATRRLEATAVGFGHGA